MPIVEKAERRIAQRRQDGTPGRTVLHRRAQDLDGVVDAVEQQILLAGKCLNTVTLETPASLATCATVTSSKPRSRNIRVATSEIFRRVSGPPRSDVLGIPPHYVD